MTVVLDGSVILRWLLPEPARGVERTIAAHLVGEAVAGAFEMLEPPHWLADVGGALQRLSPATARADVARLQAMEWPVSDHPLLYARALELADAFQVGFGESLYHAVALSTDDAVLVTADRRYLRRASGAGRLTALADWAGAGGAGEGGSA